MHHEEEKKESVCSFFVYWCLYMFIQQVLSIQALFIWYELGKYKCFLLHNRIFFHKSSKESHLLQ